MAEGRSACKGYPALCDGNGQNIAAVMDMSSIWEKPLQAVMISVRSVR